MLEGEVAGPRPGQTVADRYLLEAVLGRGGMGTVWRAHHGALDRDVAIKFMVGEQLTSDTSRARFEREARAVAKLRSPHIVEVLDHGTEKGRPFIVMELLAGEDLGAWLRTEKKLPPALVLEIARQTARALDHAHERGIVHRDLKPSNICLTSVDGQLWVKLLDFGLAKWREVETQEDLTLTNVTMGSPRYMAPEQARSARVADHRADLWSLAVVVFRCLSGKYLFDGPTPTAILSKVCFEPIPLATEVAPELPAALDPFFRRALQRDVERRFQCARDLVEALAEALELPVSLDSVAPALSAPSRTPAPAWKPRPSFVPSVTATASLPDGYVPGHSTDDAAPEAEPSDGDREATTVVNASIPRVPASPEELARRRRERLLMGVALSATGIAAVAVAVATRAPAATAKSTLAASVSRHAFSALDLTAAPEVDAGPAAEPDVPAEPMDLDEPDEPPPATATKATTPPRPRAHGHRAPQPSPKPESADKPKADAPPSWGF